MVTATPSRIAALDAVRALGDATVSELAARAGMSRPTLDSALGWLAERGLVEHRVDVVQPHEYGGRPARRSRFRADAGAVAALDLVGTSIKVAVADLSGRWLTFRTTDAPAPDIARPGIEPLETALRSALSAAGVAREDLRAVGIGVSGVAQADGTMTTSPLVPAWEGRALGPEVEALLGAPVTIDNDLSLAAVAEARHGALRGVPTGVYVQTWPRVSARVVLDGSLARGRQRMAGEIGAVRAFNTAVHASSQPFGQELARFDDALQRLRAAPDDAEGLTVLENLIEGMTPAVTALALALAPDAIVLGGRLGHYADLLASPLRAAVQAFVVAGPAVDPVVTGARLVDRGVLVGAFDQAFARFGSQIYGLDGVPAPVQRFGPEER
ncbi:MULTISPECIES: ROK family transcriptional regulator [unclassified Isoptericola]|uniref:ROK family transcriptional regulator n=1 Tax=unclassified Isoptericola TaxID=2623355 RepID=UPI0036588258